MQLMIRQRIFSWSDTYDIYDETGEARYFVQAELFRLGHQIHVFDKRSGEEVGSIHQHLISFLPAFDVVLSGRHMGTVQKKFSMFVPRYAVDYRGWNVEGDMLSWNYRVTDRGQTVMSISKELFSWGDTYVLQYSSPEDELPGLMLVLAIDAANCSNS